jgi:hypothetical protein
VSDEEYTAYTPAQLAARRAQERAKRRRARRRLLIGVWFAVGGVVAAFGVTGIGGGGAAAAIPTGTTVEVSTTPTSGPIAPGFVGLSTEFTSLLPYLGDDPAAPNPTFIALVRALAPGARPVLRIGGDSTDWTWLPVRGITRPRGIRYSISPRSLAVLGAAARALDARVILGVNLEADSTAIAGAEARAFIRTLGTNLVGGLELGNEPELYSAFGWYTTAAGVRVRGRPRGYRVGSYIRDFHTISAALPKSVPLVGPASGAPKYVAAASRFLAGNPRVKIVTYHTYPLHRCFTPLTSPQYPTIPNLISDQAALSPAAFVKTAIAAAHASGDQFRIDEFNSVSCEGKRGVSDTFASALWAVDALFTLVAAGVDGVNVHTLTSAAYAPFSFDQRDGRWRAQVTPLYYGLLLFTRAAPAGSRLIPTTVPAKTGLDSYATIAAGGTVRLVLLNDSQTRTVPVLVPAPAGAHTATLQRLRAPSLSAKSGVTLAGQTFGSWSTTGTLGGTPHVTTLHQIDRVFAFRVPPSSAALLTIAP